MPSIRKVLDAVLSGRADANTRFDSLRRLLRGLGFAERIRGDHYIFSRADVVEIINVQPLRGGKAKSYQVKQVRQLITKYGMAIGE